LRFGHSAQGLHAMEMEGMMVLLEEGVGGVVGVEEVFKSSLGLWGCENPLRLVVIWMDL